MTLSSTLTEALGPERVEAVLSRLEMEAYDELRICLAKFAELGYDANNVIALIEQYYVNKDLEANAFKAFEEFIATQVTKNSYAE